MKLTKCKTTFEGRSLVLTFKDATLDPNSAQMAKFTNKNNIIFYFFGKCSQIILFNI